jgi:nicotinate-nucleotide pyrophosphorylase (carboxylating)
MISQWKNLLLDGLKEDDWHWDVTSQGLDSQSNAKLFCKANGIWAASELFVALEVLARDFGQEVKIKTPSGLANSQKVESGQILAEWSGPSRLLLALERPALNLASYACGIATATHWYVEKVKAKNLSIRICPTRKTLPGYRHLAIHSVVAGGGKPHRLNLSGGVLIKENHISSAGNIGRAVDLAKANAPHSLKIEVEVTDLDEMQEAIQAGADSVLLDNFTPSLVREALEIKSSTKDRLVVEVSGGINEENLDDYLLEGIDVISIGSLTHSVKALDFSLLFDRKND